MFKKIGLLLLVCSLFSVSVLASDTGLSVKEQKLMNLKYEKQTKCRVLNVQIKALEDKMKAIAEDENLSQEVKDNQLLELSQKITNLKIKKDEINYQYKMDKKSIKRTQK